MDVNLCMYGMMEEITIYYVGWSEIQLILYYGWNKSCTSGWTQLVDD